MQKLTSYIVSAVVALALIAFAAYVLIGEYSDVLFTAQDRNSFVFGSQFFAETMDRPLGLFLYAGAFLTQMFFHPELGAGILIAVWIAIVLAGKMAFNLRGMWWSLMIVPAACLLTSVVDLGYWIYCLNINGYWFSQSVSYLCFLLLLWAAKATPRRYHIVWYVVIGVLGFPVFGWYSYLFTACLLLMQCRKGSIPSWVDALGVVLTAVAPLVFYALFFEKMHISSVYDAGFPFFKTSTNFSLRPSIPFFVLAGFTLLLSLGGLVREYKGKYAALLSHITMIVIALASAYGVWASIFRDANYVYEMQMTQAAMADDWQGVIGVAEKTNTPSRTMVMLKNIALINTGELGERSFELGNDGVEINNPDSLDVNIMQIASPVVYYNYGKINYAMRWCMEFSVAYGFSMFQLRNLARCAMATGEKELSDRYTDRLHRSLFYSDWKPTPASPIVKELQTSFPDVLDSDENSCERYIISVFSRGLREDSPLLTELAVFYSMLLREPKLFSQAFYYYAKAYEKDIFPVSYEEAYCLFSERTPQYFPYHIVTTPTASQRFQEFWSDGNQYAEYGYDEDGVANALKGKWGDSYYWFNAFGRNEY